MYFFPDNLEIIYLMWTKDRTVKQKIGMNIGRFIFVQK